MMKLYSTGCPRCHVLQSLLDKRDLKYEIINDIDIMTEKGFMSVPMLEVEIDDEIKIMNYAEAFKWINN